MPRKINDLNMRDLNSSIELQNLLDVRETRDSKFDINAKVFPRYNKQIPVQLSPEELSMKDLIDKIQVQSILMNNISSFVKREIKSEVTEEMTKDFQNEISKPVEINGTLYKFRPPNVDVVLQPELPEFIDERTYKLDTNAKVQQRINQKTFAEDKLDELNDSIFDLRQDYDGGKISEVLYNDTLRKMTESENALRRSLNIINFAIVDLGKEWDSYDEKKWNTMLEQPMLKEIKKKHLPIMKTNYGHEILVLKVHINRMKAMKIMLSA